MTRSTPQSGYIVFSSLLVVAAILLLVVITSASGSLTSLTTTLGVRQSAQSQALVEGCVDLALASLAATGSTATSYAMPEGSCTVSASPLSAGWELAVEGTFFSYTHRVQVLVRTGSPLTITGWQVVK